MHIVVIAGGELPEPIDRLELRRAVEAADLAIAADGGLRHCDTLGIRPQVVIGDLDSVSPASLERARAAGAEIREFSTDKDATDLELAIEEALDRGATRVSVVAAFGGRLDHELATIGLLASAQTAAVSVDAWDGRRRLWILRGSLQLDLEPGTTVSIIPLQGTARAVSTSGLRWPLEAEDLAFGSTRGVSNVVVSRPQEIELAAGVAAVISG